MPAGSEVVTTIAIRRLPALTAEIGDMRTDHQILNHEAGVAFEARPGRGAALTVCSSWIVSFDSVLPRLPPPSPAGLSGSSPS